MAELGYTGVEMVCFARPGTTTVNFIQEMLLDPRLPRIDLFLVDYTVNDGLADPMIPPATEFLVKFLLTLPQAPALVYLETFPRVFLGRRRLYFCKFAVNTFPHWQALRRAAVPVISYYDAVCKAPEGLPFWEPQPHPYCESHEHVARVVVGYLLQWMHRFCAAPAPPADDHPRAPLAQVFPEFECGRRPVFQHSACEGPDRLRVLPDPFWRFEEDVPGKPGWIAQRGHTATISFPLHHSAGPGLLLGVSYLKTYEDIGRVTCWFAWRGGHSPPVVLDGLSTSGDRVSMPSETLLGPHTEPGAFNLTCVSDKRKFKITAIRGCQTGNDTTSPPPPYHLHHGWW